MGIFEEITKKKNNSDNNTLFSQITNISSAGDMLERQKNKELEAKKIADDYAKQNNIMLPYVNDRTAPNRGTAINVISSTPKYDDNQKQLLSQPNKYEVLNKTIEDTQKKYTDYYNSPEYQNYVNEYYTTPIYQYNADLEKVNNQDNFSLGEKAFNSFFGGLRSALHGDRQYKTTDSNGKTVYVDLPNYQQLKGEKIKEQSGTLGKIYQDAMASIGQMVPSIVAGTITGGLGLGTELGSLGTMAINAYSGSKNEKLLNGYSEEQAEMYGALSAGVEVITEKMFGGLGKLMGKGALDEYVTDRLTKNITNRVAKGLAELGISSLGEGIEEVVSDLAQPIIKKIALSDEKSLKELFADENLGEDFFAGVLSSVILGGYNTVKTINNNVNNNQNDNINVDNSIINNELNNEQTNTISNNSYSDVDNNEQLITSNLDEYKQNIQQRNNIEQQEELNNQVNNMQKQINEVNNNIEEIKQDNDFIPSEKLTREIEYKTKNNFKNNSKVKFMPLVDVLKYKDSSGGYRSVEKVSGLENDIKKNGITSPIELTKNSDGRIEIANGNHRLDVANKYKLKEVPIKYVQNISDFMKQIAEDEKNVYNSIESAGSEYVKNKTNYNSKENAEYYDRSGNIGKKNVNNYISSSNKETTKRNVLLPQAIQGDNNRSSITSRAGNNTKQLENRHFTKKSDNNTNTDVNTILPNKKNHNSNLPLAKTTDTLRVKAEKIAKQINDKGDFDLKQRSWVETSTESDVLKDKVYIDDLDVNKINYQVQSNKKSLEEANKHIKNYGYEKSLDYVKNLMQSDKLPSASDVALIQRMIQEASKKGDIKTVQDLIMDTAIIGTDLGQATQALSIIQKLTPEGQLKLYTKIVQRAKARGEKSFENVEITPEMVEKVLSVYNGDGTFDQDELNAKIEEFKQDIANQMKSTAMERIDAWRYLSMLGNPKTHIRNMVSNIAMTGTIKVKNAMARTLETLLPVKERTKTWKKSSQEVKDFAKQTAIDMKGIITGENKYNEKSTIESKKQIFKNKTLEKISDFNSNALEAEDWFFSKRAFQSTLEEYLTANNINSYEDIKNNPELIEKAKIYAVEQAEIATFRQYSKLASMINQFERKSKVGKVATEALMPFKKTPINVAKAGVNYSPLGLIKNISYDVYQLKQGNINASQFIDKLSQGLTGTSLTLIGYALAKSGILNGSGGDDKDDKYDKQLGKSGYSLNIGGNSYSISWLSPVAMPLLVGANAYEQLEEEKEWDMNVVSDSLAKTLDPLNEMSFMQGLTNALQSYGSGTDKIKGALESTAQNYVGQFFPTLFSQFAGTIDDKKRSTKASNNGKYKFGEQTVRSIMYKLPGLRQQLEVATDIWGNEKEQSSNIIERAVENFIAPYSKTKDISTDLDKELKKIYNETGETGVIPSIPYAYIKYGDNTYRMSAKEYTQYKKTYGQTANKLLNNTISSENYKNLSYEEKSKVLENIFGYSKYLANKEYFDNENIDYSSKEYVKPELYSKIGDISDYYLSKVKKFTADKDGDGKTISGSAKNKTIQYINSLKATIPEKAILIKMYGNFTFNDYNSQIIDYVNSKKLTIEEKQKILEELDFTIKDGRVYW